MKIALIDLEEDKNGCNNKDQTGTYGSVMDAGGLAGTVFNLLKKNLLRLPILYFGYMASILRSRGHAVAIYSSFPSDEDVVIIATSIIGYKQEIEFARKLKANGDYRIRFVGAIARAVPGPFLEVGDFVIDGEPEQWAIDIDSEINRDGMVPSKRVNDLDSLPFPDWRGFPIEKYGYFPLLKNKPFLTLLSSRGCPFACPYCQYLPMQGKKWRKRAPENVVEEIAYLVKDFGVKSLLFRDIVFSLDMDRVRKIAELLIAQRIAVSWGCETRADCLDRDMILLMKKAGLRFINLGIESPDAKKLAEHGRKPIELTLFEDLVAFCENNDVKINGFYIIGFQEDTEAKIRDTIRYACKLNTSLAQFCVVTPYPGTPFFTEMKAQGRLLDVDWDAYTTYNPVMKLDHLSSADILRIKKLAYNRYLLRPEWLLKRGSKLLLK